MDRCPRCKGKLIENDKSVITSLPPKVEVRCVICGWTGIRKKKQG